MKKPVFTNGSYYHVYNRGVEKRKIFQDQNDYLRFIHDLYEFNDRNAVVAFPQRTQRIARRTSRETLGGLTSMSFRGPKPAPKERKILVDIIAWVLMPNHFHLLLRQHSDSGVSLFMQKLGTGYTLYFNQRYERSGVLFQGTFRAKGVWEDRYLRHLVTYIHANPVDLFGKKNTTIGILKALEQYRWSSYLDYLEIQNVPSLLHHELIRDLELPQGAAQRMAMEDWIKQREEREEDIAEFLLKH